MCISGCHRRTLLSGGTRGGDTYQHLAKVLTQIGTAVLIFDRRGQGQSAGDFHNVSFEDLTSDLLFAKDVLKARQDIGKIGLWGMSQGGWLAPFAASLSKDIAFLVVVSGTPVTPAEQMLYSATFALEENGFTSTDVDEMHALRKLHDGLYRSKVSRSLVQKKIQEAKSQAWFPFAYISADLPTDIEKTKWHKTLDFNLTTFIDSVKMPSVKVPTLLVYGEVDPWIPIGESISQWQKKLINLIVRQIEDANHFMLTISGSGIDGDAGVISSRYQQLMVDWLEEHVLD